MDKTSSSPPFHYLHVHKSTKTGCLSKFHDEKYVSLIFFHFRSPRSHLDSRHLMCGPSKRIVRKEAQYRTHQVPALLYKARKVIPQTELSISLKRPFLSKKTISCYILPLCFSLFSSFFTLFCFQHNWLKGSIIWYVNYKFYYTHSYKCTSGLVVE